jgi:hypothetical protein
MMSTEPLARDFAHLVAVLRQRADLPGARVLPRRGHAGGHVGVLRVGEDEILRAARVGVNVRQFLVE